MTVLLLSEAGIRRKTDGTHCLLQITIPVAGTAAIQGAKIAIKANINGSAVFDDDTSGKIQMSYTNPVLLKALLISLVKEGGVNPSDITVYDVSHLFPDYMVKMCTDGELKGIQFVD